MLTALEKQRVHGLLPAKGGPCNRKNRLCRGSGPLAVPGRRHYPPDRFIPVFERKYMIDRLDQYVYEEVCRWLRSLLDSGRTPSRVGQCIPASIL